MGEENNRRRGKENRKSDKGHGSEADEQPKGDVAKDDSEEEQNKRKKGAGRCPHVRPVQLCRTLSTVKSWKITQIGQYTRYISSKTQKRAHYSRITHKHVSHYPD